MKVSLSDTVRLNPGFHCNFLCKKAIEPFRMLLLLRSITYTTHSSWFVNLYLLWQRNYSVTRLHGRIKAERVSPVVFGFGDWRDQSTPTRAGPRGPRAQRPSKPGRVGLQPCSRTSCHRPDNCSACGQARLQRCDLDRSSWLQSSPWRQRPKLSNERVADLS